MTPEDPLIRGNRRIAISATLSAVILGFMPLLSGRDVMDIAHGADSTVIRELGGFIEHGIGSAPCGITIACFITF